ncbi:hypothetical protein N7462_004565 [Penicillium macrosclerotiorum]|uniref:uncharacterized protein n=1 Tax=Penicillium macrosclerotiorum TaxID=303699 RepID=UPI00254816C5|nr:uncharacterized protein N7462_004565 [Penicillium macrosclerotiorum]KAJ5690173.1 hypothetical protein N7462_004565 [Penicillium macrosclerotiorum]
MAYRVLLTGGNGFIGSHILSELVQKGHQVCCTVRTPEKGERILNDFKNYNSQISLAIVPDITTPGAFDLAVNDEFDIVFHAASPFVYGTVENNREFLDPAIKGTTEILRSVKQHAPSVKRVIFTSSCAAVIDYDRLKSGDLYNEDNWNPISWEEALHGDPSKAYRASKKFAEIAAWEFIKNEKPHFDLVTLCPPATLGPLKHSIHSIKDLNESNSRIWRLSCQSSKSTPMPYIPVHTYVDVRDLARVQIQAMLVPEAANHRFIVCARQFGFQDICDILRSNFPDLDPRVPLGNPGSSSLPAGAYSTDNSKVRRILGVEFRDLKETINDLAKQFLEIESYEKSERTGFD